jgi:hypothetical protein
MSSCSYESLHPAKPFVFITPAIQNEANAVYIGMSTINAQQVNPVKRFKTDRERMQYLQGQRARDTNCCNGPGGRCTTTG